MSHADDRHAEVVPSRPGIRPPVERTEADFDPQATDFMRQNAAIERAQFARHDKEADMRRSQRS